ncbi:MAG TPA: carbohydrate porin [Steroidobacteraceae bacterium]|nr:carbohydrate porin [Steroidobacteraceae bacterium]
MIRAPAVSWVFLWAAAAAAAATDEEVFAVHGQFTYVEQETLGFNAPYRGANSLSPNTGAETTDATVYVGARLWPGAEAWLNGELDQGFGLDDTLGAAGFPSGEAYKVGKNQPYARLPRAFLRQTFDLPGEAHPLEGEANQLRGSQSENRVVLTVGKFSVVDIFDTNQFAHDARMDFLNWSVIDAGTFDYAADAWGYTVGAALEWYFHEWTLRGGVFDLSDVPNSARLDPGFHEFQTDLEIEHRHEIANRSGRVLLTAFESRGRMGLLDEAVAVAENSNMPVSIAAVRRYRSRAGVSLSIEQQIAPDLGAFIRAGKAAGNVEAYEFTDIDRTLAVGVSLQGSRWHRPGDTIGLAAVDNGISAARERYLNAGGLGILVGDGRLPHPGPEQIIETYYSAAVLRVARISMDYQWIGHPAYNRDRGPASVIAVRLHAQF